MTDLLPLLQDFYKDKLDELLRHIAASRVVAQYDANNTYQYIVNRDEAHLSWVGRSIVDLDGTVPTGGSEPTVAHGKDAERAVFDEDARRAQAFVDRWQPRVSAMSNARHRGMLNVILGEALEQKRFFEQARAGDVNLLGRRTNSGERVGEVLPTRWIE